MEVPQIDLTATGNNIRRIRKELDISVLEISELLMIDKQAVYRWEYGKSLPQLENFLALARMFHTTIENIIVEKGEAYPPLPSFYICFCILVQSDRFRSPFAGCFRIRPHGPLSLNRFSLAPPWLP